MEYSLLQHLGYSETVNTPKVVTKEEKDDRILRPSEANETHLLKKFPPFYGIRKFVSAFITDRHLTHSKPDKSTICLPIPPLKDQF